jgi:hypothetical protein
MGKRFRMQGVKSTPKSLEKELLDNARRLAEDPSILIPKQVGEECRRCKWPKLQKKLAKVQQYKNDSDKLVKLAGRGDQLVRAYAATISLAAAGKVPYLSTAQLPVGEVSYAVRGTVDKEKLIALQHFDDPDLRLLGYWEMARDKDLHIYSTEKGLYCSATGPNAPEEYVNEVTVGLDYDLKEGSCPHPNDTSLVVEWVSAKRTVRVCRECAGKGNVVTDLYARIAAPDHTDDFKVTAQMRFHCNETDVKQCQAEQGVNISKDLSTRYLKGELSDQEFLVAATGEHLANLKTDPKVYIIGSECYGNDMERFLENVKGSDLERVALTGLVRKKGLVVVSESNQAGKMLTELWDQHKVDIISQVACPEVVAQFTSRTDLAPPALIAEASRTELCKSISGALPNYTKLGEIGKVADSMARTYKTEGRESMARSVDKVKKSNHRVKAVCYAFLKATGESSKSWQFNKEETEFGNYLMPFAQSMLTAVGIEYDQALRNLLTASGSNEEAA